MATWIPRNSAKETYMTVSLWTTKSIPQALKAVLSNSVCTKTASSKVLTKIRAFLSLQITTTNSLIKMISPSFAKATRNKLRRQASRCQVIRLSGSAARSKSRVKSTFRARMSTTIFSRLRAWLRATLMTLRSNLAWTGLRSFLNNKSIWCPKRLSVKTISGRRKKTSKRPCSQLKQIRTTRLWR